MRTVVDVDQSSRLTCYTQSSPFFTGKIVHKALLVQVALDVAQVGIGGNGKERVTFPFSIPFHAAQINQMYALKSAHFGGRWAGGAGPPAGAAAGCPGGGRLSCADAAQVVQQAPRGILVALQHTRVCTPTGEVVWCRLIHCVNAFECTPPCAHIAQPVRYKKQRDTEEQALIDVIVDWGTVTPGSECQVIDVTVDWCKTYESKDCGTSATARRATYARDNNKRWAKQCPYLQDFLNLDHEAHPNLELLLLQLLGIAACIGVDMLAFYQGLRRHVMFWSTMLKLFSLSRPHGLTQSGIAQMARNLQAQEAQYWPVTQDMGRALNLCGLKPCLQPGQRKCAADTHNLCAT
eukprot:1160701-Pelagomonas_calceolata.AAC.3